MSEIYVDLEFTPNPDSLKYLVNRSILTKGTLFLSSAEEAKEKSELAESLFQLGGIKSVMLGAGFVTVSLQSQDELHELNEKITECIRAHLKEGRPVVKPGAIQESTDQTFSEVEQKIVDFLNAEVRPAVAMDGGDIQFESFQEGVVYLKMQGSCSGCPSSLMTLKEGVESRLKTLVPEVKEVVPV
ncbi:MAG: NifU family protein [Bradymonadales bacterium]|nr:MAG: NifU family protein [Bradymonadales bacterium]